jgi:glyoxylase-like metal-dependent hydrolase (beta-lactamase superfamily II)
VTGVLQYATTYARRAGLTRDLPQGDNEDLRWVSNTATLIYGERDAILVDTFTTIEQNEQLIAWVRSFDRTLTFVYVTHGHGDHCFGVKQLQEEFPGVGAVATAGTVEACRQQGSAEFVDAFWGALFPGEIPLPQVAPEVLDGEGLDLEGHRLEVVETGFTDTRDSTALWAPDLRLLVAGDVAYNGIHLYTPETNTETRGAWATALGRLEHLDPAFVVAGHKRPERDDEPAILAETRRYLEDFNRVDGETSTPLELYEGMLALHPDRANPGALWGGAKAAKA